MFEPAPKSAGSLVKIQIAGPNPRGSDSGGLGQALRICISIEFPGAAVVPPTLSGTPL